MADESGTRAALKRVVDIFTRRPHKGLSTSTGTAVVNDGLRATFRAGDESAEMDMPEIMGGGGKAPTPGFYARAGIASCVAIGIKMAAVRSDVDLRRVEVRVETDFDDSAIFDLGEASAAPLETRLVIGIETDAPEAEVHAVIDRALACDPWYLALKDAQSVRPVVEVSA